MVEGKLKKAVESLEKALFSYEKGDPRLTKGDLDFVKENIEEAEYLLKAEIEKEEVGSEEEYEMLIRKG